MFLNKEQKEEIKKIRLKNELEKAINYFVENTSINEVLEECKWYKVYSVEDLKNAMYESYLDTYTDEELKERIKMLYE